MVDRFEEYAPLGLCRYKLKFLNCHLPDLITRIKDVYSVLRDLQDPDLLPENQYNALMEKTTSEEKMEALCDIICRWEDTGKYTAYSVLREYNEETIRDLEMEDWLKRRSPSGSPNDKVMFIDLHQSFLVRRIKNVDPVLCDLWNKDLLSDEQYNDMIRKKTSNEKMRGLCDIYSHWENSEKYTAYTVLRKYNEEIIRDLEMKSWKRSRAHPLSYSDMVNFIDCHSSDLVRWIKDADPALRYFWYHDLLTVEQYHDSLGGHLEVHGL
ncbi:uncharacterized protein LOC142302827 [Anomaloglossus baeobatrachus]|uniref:uncharacterized protein LOC142302827 n=1 Tax=Anomaloglossus baeobatrachus TaxID=238106 RepID=UPI003F508380